jgi:cation transport ATPase
MCTYLRVMKSNGRGLCVSLALVFSGTAGAAGLIEVKQVVYGMDCAPCAHGLEVGLEEMEGVKNATVSLNDGYAAVELNRDNSVTLEQLQQIVKNNGFTPKTAEVEVFGTLARANDNQLMLTTETGQQYTLSAARDMQPAWERLKALPSGSEVELKAQVPEGQTDQLAVQAVEIL